MVAIIASLAVAVILYGALILLFRAPPKRLPKPQPRAVVSNWPVGIVGRRYR